LQLTHFLVPTQGGLYAPSIFIGASLGTAFGLMAHAVGDPLGMTLAAPQAYALVGECFDLIHMGGSFGVLMHAGRMLLEPCLCGSRAGCLTASCGRENLSQVPFPANCARAGVAAMLASNCSVPLTSVLLLFELTRDYLIILPTMAAVGIR